MFKELAALLTKRSLTITVAALGEGRIRVNVIPHSRPEDTKVNEQITYSHKEEVAAIPESAVKALTTPISLTGTAEEIDERLSEVLLQFVESHTQLQATFDRASADISNAVKAIDERNKNKSKTRAASKTEQKDDSKTKADDGKSQKDETLPLWWTNSAVQPPGVTAPQSTSPPSDNGLERQSTNTPEVAQCR